MGTRGGGGGLQGLLEHAAREYEKVDTEARGPEVLRSEETTTDALVKRSNRPAESPSASAGPKERSADRATSSRGDGSSPRGAGTPSRKRQRVDSGSLGMSPSPSRELNSHFSEDGGGSAGESYAGDAEAATAGKGGAGTIAVRLVFVCFPGQERIVSDYYSTSHRFGKFEHVAIVCPDWESATAGSDALSLSLCAI